MLDILAVLDAAIDELQPAASSRTSRSGTRPGSAPGTTKCLKNNAVPVVPVLPATKQRMRGTIEKTNRAGIAEKIESGSRESLLFSTGSTGSTGSFEDSCGVPRSRDGEMARGVTGSTGTGGELDLDQLDPAHPIGDLPPHRWKQFIADSRAFRASAFAEHAEALGWTYADLYGCDDKRPYARIDRMGLVWLLKGDRLIAMTADTAVIETKSGSRLTFYKKNRPVADGGATKAVG